jgi:acyl-coenzyme A synthetase/AMP-(fatty) acid ligase
VSEEQIVSDAVHAWQQGYPISDLQARVIASQWHGGQSSALYSLASCGATVSRADDWEDESPTDRLLSEIAQEGLSTLGMLPEQEELQALASYVECVGPRGPVEGWSDLHW